MKKILLLLLALSSITTKAYLQVCTFKQVSAKTTHAMGIGLDGKLYGWGANSSGQLGLGTTTDRELLPKQVGNDTDWKKVETGNPSAFTCAIKNNGTLWIWGNNTFGNFGNSTVGTTSSTPQKLGADTDWADVSIGYFSVLALKTNGTLWVWGINYHDNSYVTKPTQIGTETNWAKIAYGPTHMFAQKKDGTLWARGLNDNGQFGNNSTTKSASFVKVNADTDWADFVAGAGFSLAIKTDGSLWAWGNNASAQLGDGTTTKRLTPTRIGTAKDWASISSSISSAAAVKKDGTLWTWGTNAAGQLGIGSSDETKVLNTPTKLGTESNWKAVMAGGGDNWGGTNPGYYTAIKQNSELYSWGSNKSGQLSQNSIVTSNAPQNICKFVSTDDIEEYTNSIAIYPNPAQQYINIVSEHSIKTLAVMNRLGQMVMTVDKDQNTNSINVEHLNVGFYVLKITTTENKEVYKKFLIAR